MSLGLPASYARSVSSEELFKQVFGANQEAKVSKVDFSFRSHFIGEVTANLQGDTLVDVNGKELKEVILPFIREEKLSAYKLQDVFLNVKTLEQSTPLKFKYFPNELRVELILPEDDVIPRDANIFSELIPYYARQAKAPAPFSLGLNYKVEQTIITNLHEESSTNAQVDAFSTIGKVALENRMSYSSKRETEWHRQSSRLIYERPEKLQRIEAGDVNYPVIGYLHPMALGGLTFHKDYALNPYQLSTPTSSLEFSIETRSLVRTYLNGSLLKTEYMNPGRYSVKDIPLYNGLNEILIETVDEFGNRKFQRFSESSSIDLLPEGKTRYSMTVGFPSFDTDQRKQYDQDEVFTSAFYQKALSKNFTSGLYGQINKNHHLAGTNLILATNYGSFAWDAVRSETKYRDGFLGQLSFQYNRIGSDWYNTHNFASKIEYRTPWFTNTGDNVSNAFDWTASASYSIPFFHQYNIGLNSSYQNPSRVQYARMNYGINLTNKLWSDGSLTIQASRNRDEFKSWSSQFFVFFNLTFGSTPSYVSAYYDHIAKVKRLTTIQDTGNSVGDIKLTSTVEDNVSSKQGSVDFQYNTVLADIGAKEEIVKQKNVEAGTRTTLRLMSAFAFVKDGENSAFSISRPISNGFAIFKPNAGWEKQKFGVQTSDGANDTETGLFGEAVVSGLTPHQYRRIQLNPLQLEPGYVLGQETFVVNPRRSSGHLFMVGQSGTAVLSGRLLDAQKNPLTLKIGYWIGEKGKTLPFFTGRDGNFLIEGVDGVAGVFVIEGDKRLELPLRIGSDKKGIVELGDLTLLPVEN